MSDNEQKEVRVWCDGWYVLYSEKSIVIVTIWALLIVASERFVLQ